MEIKEATIDHLPSIVRLLADDELGKTRECYKEPLPQPYIDAFHQIEKQMGNSLIIAMDNQEVIGCLQLTFIPGIARFGAVRAQIEGVRVDPRYRGNGVGESLFQYAIEMAKANSCSMVQLTTDKNRKEAHRFYERLGFIASHDGMKLVIND